MLRYALFTASLICSTFSAAADELLERLTLPKGYEISYFAKNVDNARQLAVSKSGVVYAGSRKAGNLYALIDNNQDGVADRKIVLAQGLNMPSGIALYNGDLYVAEVHRIIRFKNVDKQLSKPSFEVVFDELPTERHHGWKFIRFTDEGELLVPVGVPCNVCAENERFGRIFSLNLQTKKLTTIAQGVRNSVGFDINPQSGALWFSDNGRDMMGDDIPPDEINRVSVDGEHFGFPYVHGGSVLDPEYAKDMSLADMQKYVAPKLALQAHVAPLGIHFYRGKQFAKHMHNKLLVAEHGSWNRSSKVGYKVMMVTIKEGEITAYEPFISGFLDKEQTLGRPVAFAELADGSLLVSDDFANAIYRVRYNNK
ncbi:sorbosone dehydrogenase family protein [Pseudoalteromonas sp. JBTF-M23]|uniref:Sorbosone dehydrogenase family protein n=1 Tax=Pseudoalteromonas caenipelagi TaxID=2726988 RepID=A0A849VJA3_9GAMM|nr:PQQ-dependent sugar dehydrogenase [Pseudoalteromonas caenipelagi]NOU51717.1 sorbosone dehydrogenase family protein [Pseudoalteromonas caenipelagi]